MVYYHYDQYGNKFAMDDIVGDIVCDIGGSSWDKVYGAHQGASGPSDISSDRVLPLLEMDLGPGTWDLPGTLLGGPKMGKGGFKLFVLGSPQKQMISHGIHTL